MNIRQLAILLLAAITAGCGVGETGAAAAAGGVSKAQELERARETQAEIERKLEEAQRRAEERMQTLDN